MWAPDVNVLVDAFRADSPHHSGVRRWLEVTLAAGEPFVLFDLVALGFLRVVTHPRVFDPPTPTLEAVEFLIALREEPAARSIVPGERQWSLFEDLAKRSSARGNLLVDAYLAALAIEAGCTWVSNDGDFARFPGLRWERPGKSAAPPPGG